MSKRDQNYFEYDVICVGAGFAGLSAAYYLLKEKPDVKVMVLEANDRVGGRTFLKTLKCADAEGNDSEYQWEMGGMWVASGQTDIQELLKELSIEIYPQYNEGKKCVKVSGDKHAKTYTSDLPSIGVLGRVDLKQAIFRLEMLVKSVDPTKPHDHPEAAIYDSMTVSTLIEKYCFTQKTKDIMTSAVRSINGGDPSQINALYFLTDCAAGGGLAANMDAAVGSSQEYKIKGGSQSVCLKMAEIIGNGNIRLSSPVVAIDQDENGVRVQVASGDVYKASYVISSLPPNMQLLVQYTPPLPHFKMKLYQRMPMGHYIKVIITYRKAYWRLRGYSGEIITTDPRPDIDIGGGLCNVFDATSEHGHPALVAFFGGDQATLWGDQPAEDRKQLVLSSLSEFFNSPELLSPIDYAEKDWARELYVGGCPCNLVSTGVMKYYVNGLNGSFGRVEFCGADASSLWAGFISGAVHTGKAAAKQTLKRFAADYEE